jgi:hypothetical protein
VSLARRSSTLNDGEASYTVTVLSWHQPTNFWGQLPQQPRSPTFLPPHPVDCTPVTGVSFNLPFICSLPFLPSSFTFPPHYSPLSSSPLPHLSISIQYPSLLVPAVGVVGVEKQALSSLQPIESESLSWSWTSVLPRGATQLVIGLINSRHSRLSELGRFSLPSRRYPRLKTTSTANLPTYLPTYLPNRLTLSRCPNPLLHFPPAANETQQLFPCVLQFSKRRDPLPPLFPLDTCKVHSAPLKRLRFSRAFGSQQLSPPGSQFLFFPALLLPRHIGYLPSPSHHRPQRHSIPDDPVRFCLVHPLVLISPHRTRQAYSKYT